MDMKILRKVTNLVALAVTLASCTTSEPKNSSDYSIQDINTSIYVASSGESNTQVVVNMYRLRELLTIPINLSSGDTLVARAYGASKDLTKVVAGQYSSTFNLNSEAVFKVSFLRAGEAGAPNSSVLLPAPFIILQPTKDQIFNNGDMINISYSNPVNHNRMSLYYNAKCFSTTPNAYVQAGSGSVTLNDIGSYSLSSVLFLIPTVGVDITQPCNVTLRITRNEFGTSDPALKGGISAKQVREVTVLVNP